MFFGGDTGEANPPYVPRRSRQWGTQDAKGWRRLAQRQTGGPVGNPQNRKMSGWMRGSMDNLWFPMENLWFIYGVSMDNPWLYGQSIWLVVPTPLKNMSSLNGMMTFATEWGKKVPNHRPDLGNGRSISRARVCQLSTSSGRLLHLHKDDQT